MNYQTEHTHPSCHPGVTDGVVWCCVVAGCAPAKPGEEHDPGDDVEHRRQQGEDHLHPHEGEGQFHLRSTQGQNFSLFTFPHLYRVLHLEQVEEGPDEGDDEGGDDDEEEEVVVPETKVIRRADCLSWGCASHTDDPKNL